MLSHGAREGFEVFIESQEGRNPLVEYQVRNIKGSFPASECYIEVIPGPFAIVTEKLNSLPYPNNDWKCRYFVDGQLIAEYALMRNVGSNVVDEIYEEEDDQLYSRKLKFLPAKTTDKPEEIKPGSKVFSRVGTIEVMIHRGAYREISTDLYQSPEIKDCTMDEKEKKMAFTVGTSERVPVEDIEVPSYDFIPRKKGDKFYKFIFKYRVHTELVKLGLKEDPETQPLSSTVQPRASEDSQNVDREAQEPHVKTEGGQEMVTDVAEDDLTKDQLKRRLKYLEESLAKSNATNKRLRAGRPMEEDVIDLTEMEDDEDQD
ncbi:uncharacterized protein L199_003114 [Kwoniella botswanensis]|uniref:uncharacterized protein n=1 Tax=Kwoniella botswanensis TaxID=1268659 RepID=UPI00315CD2A9